MVPARLDQVRLHELCSRPVAEVSPEDLFDLVAELGPIGSLWLRPEVFDRSIAWRRACNREPPAERSWTSPRLEQGQIGILLETQTAAATPLLRPAFVLPVEWRRGSDHSPQLPRGLPEEAAKVLEDLGIGGLSLHLAGWLEAAGCDFSGFSFSSASAWAALAAGAVVAHENGVTLPEVLVTAAWKREPAGNKGRILRVDGVAEKTAAAALSGAKILLVPQENAEELESLPADHPGRQLDIRFLPNIPTSPRTAIVEVLRLLQAMPRRDTVPELEPRCRYFSRLLPAPQNEYYCNHILPDIVTKLKARVDTDPRLSGVDGVVMIASRSWSLAVLVARVFKDAKVLLLHDEPMSDEARRLCERIVGPMSGGQRPRTVQLASCGSGDAFAADVAAAVQKFSADCSRLVVDLTAGYRHYMFALLLALPRNAVATYIETQQDPETRSVLPQTADMRVLAPHIGD